MKTLSATIISAAALVGSLASADQEIFLSQKSDGDDIRVSSGNVLVNIDAQPTLSYIRLEAVSSLTLDFRGEYILAISTYFDEPDDGVINITSTVPSVVALWKDEFSVEGGGSITLCTAGSIFCGYAPDKLQFLGAGVDGHISLGGTDVVFKGAVDDLESLSNNQIGFVWESNDITLVGKIDAAPVPEPATGTLSLLALAGLCRAAAAESKSSL